MDRDPLDEFFWREDEPALDLPELLVPGAARARPELAEALRDWLVFDLAGEEHAIGIEVVREILKAPSITEVPRAPTHVLGVIMVRGEVIAVVDPRARLGLPRAPPGAKARVIVCEGGGGPVGLLVDGVSEVVRLPSSAVEARPSIGNAADELVQGVGRVGNRLLLLLDLGVLLRSEAAPAHAATEAVEGLR